MKKKPILNDRIKGIAIPNIVAVVIMVISTFLQKTLLGPVLFASNFVLLPIVMGLISAYQWQNLDLTTRQRLKYSFYMCLIALMLSAFFTMEGYICLIIVSPLIYVFLIAGVFLGKYLFEKRSNRLNISLGSLLVFLFVIDLLSPHDYKRMVADEIIINAPPAKIWNNVVAFEPIKEKPKYWLFQIGMPKPIATTVDGYYQGAGRKCIFNNGIVFKEKMVVFEPEKNLTFDITEQPNDPEILGHIEITRGQFILKDNHNGTTTLIGNSWYRLFVFPSWYYDLWAESITRNVHLRVMEHIKYLSEKN